MICLWEFPSNHIWNILKSARCSKDTGNYSGVILSRWISSPYFVPNPGTWKKVVKLNNSFKPDKTLWFQIVVYILSNMPDSRHSPQSKIFSRISSSANKWAVSRHGSAGNRTMLRIPSFRGRHFGSTVYQLQEQKRFGRTRQRLWGKFCSHSESKRFCRGIDTSLEDDVIGEGARQSELVVRDDAIEPLGAKSWGRGGAGDCCAQDEFFPTRCREFSAGRWRLVLWKRKQHVNLQQNPHDNNSNNNIIKNDDNNNDKDKY